MCDDARRCPCDSCRSARVLGHPTYRRPVEYILQRLLGPAQEDDTEEWLAMKHMAAQQVMHDCEIRGRWWLHAQRWGWHDVLRHGSYLPLTVKDEPDEDTTHVESPVDDHLEAQLFGEDSDDAAAPAPSGASAAPAPSGTTTFSTVSTSQTRTSVTLPAGRPAETEPTEPADTSDSEAENESPSPGPPWRNGMRTWTEMECGRCSSTMRTWEDARGIERSFCRACASAGYQQCREHMGPGLAGSSDDDIDQSFIDALFQSHPPPPESEATNSDDCDEYSDSNDSGWGTFQSPGPERLASRRRLAALRTAAGVANGDTGPDDGSDEDPDDPDDDGEGIDGNATDSYSSLDSEESPEESAAESAVESAAFVSQKRRLALSAALERMRQPPPEEKRHRSAAAALQRLEAGQAPSAPALARSTPPVDLALPPSASGVEPSAALTVSHALALADALGAFGLPSTPESSGIHVPMEVCSSQSEADLAEDCEDSDLDDWEVPVARFEKFR